MRTSVNWLNDYLDPPATADEQAELLTRAGLPFDGRESVDGGDIRQEIETTSNRGDCLCHLGLAREVAAMSGRRVRPPAAAPAATGPAVESVASVVNERPDLCPLYTARVILGARIGPSPAWLAERLRAIGQIPRNNVVDATNFVLFELGQPTHVFDLDRLAGSRVIVRMARPEEPFLPIGEGAAEVRLSAHDLVIADAERAVAIAGVKGGALSAVREGTINLLLEAATFDPVAVRRSSARLRIASDSSHRFERGVHPAQIDAAAERLAALILESAGGVLCQGVLREGRALPAPRTIRLRVERCRERLGIPLPTQSMVAALSTLGFSPRPAETGDGAVIDVDVPAHRLDIEREIDVVEEVARMAGLDTLPVHDTIAIRLAPPQPRIAARLAIRDALAGLGFVETVTHSLVSDAAAAPFVPAGAAALRVDDERAKSEPVMRPSVVPSLLRVRRHNLDNGVSPLSLFEIAAVFELRPDGHRERETLAMTSDLVSPDEGLRPLRGVVERVLRLLLGESAAISLRPTPATSWLAPAAEIVLHGAAARGGDPTSSPSPAAGVELSTSRSPSPSASSDRVVGVIGVVTPAALRSAGLATPQVTAEIDLAGVLDAFPPHPKAQALPAFPAISRDVSAIVAEAIEWSTLEGTLRAMHLPMLERIDFVTAFRAASIGAGRKSVTARLRFRAGDRTLRHEEVDPQMAAAMAALRSELSAEIRT